MVKIYLLLFVLPVLVVSTDGHPIQLEYLNLTAKIYSPCPTFIETCPRTDDEKNGRMLCMFLQPSCPSDNSFYFCDIDSQTNVLVEDCFHRHTCDAGTKNAVRLDLKPTGSTASLDCVQCSKYRVQRQPHDSSQRFISECDDSRITIDFNNMLPTMKLVAERWPSGFDIYACDSTRGYRNKYRTSLCDTTSLCSCITDIKCTYPDKPILLSNGQCDAVCDKGRDPFQDYSCPSYSAGLGTANPTKTDEHNESGSNSNITDKPQSKQNYSSFGPVGIVLVCFGIIAVGIVVVVVLYCCCREKIQYLLKRACVISRTDTDATEKLPEDPAEVAFLGVQDEIVAARDCEASNGHHANLTEANGHKQGKRIKVVETNGEKVEIRGKIITYNQYEIHHHHQPERQQEQKLTEDNNVDSDGYPEQAMQYYPSN